MIAIIDYATGNLCSVENAFKRVGAEYVVTADEKVIRAASHVVLPGVGEASSAMERLRDTGLEDVIRSLTQPVMGICIGMQLMCRSSREGDVRCLGIFDTQVVKIEPAPGVKVPHMGWDTLEGLRTPLFDGIEAGWHFYYVHSFAPEVCAHTIARTDYGFPFSAALGRDNFFGVQFHPEKSGPWGETLLKNFLKL